MSDPTVLILDTSPGPGWTESRRLLRDRVDVLAPAGWTVRFRSTVVSALVDDLHAAGHDADLLSPRDEAAAVDLVHVVGSWPRAHPWLPEAPSVIEPDEETLERGDPGRADVLLLGSGLDVRRVRPFFRGREIAVLPPGVRSIDPLSARSRELERARLAVAPGEALLVGTGSRRPGSGQHVAVQAATALARRGIRFRWVFIGPVEDREFARAVEDRIAREGLAGRIVALDDRADRAGLLAAADLLVHTAATDERAVLDALAAGTPAVVPAGGRCLALVRERVDGRLYPARNADLLADVLATLLLVERPHLREMGSRGRVRVERDYPIAAHVTALAGVYARAAGVAIPPVEEYPPAPSFPAVSRSWRRLAS